MGPTDECSAQRRKIVVLGLLVLIGLCILWSRWRVPPPQMETDEEVFKTVDALFTAITSHNQKQLDDCDRRLGGCRTAGSLPKNAADFLDSVVREARSGDWNSAAKRLYDFMYGQRRR